MGVHNFDIKYRYSLISLYKLSALFDFCLFCRVYFIVLFTFL